MKAHRRIYLDHAGMTPLDGRVRHIMEPWLERPANPSALHAEGREARHALDSARQALARLWGRKPRHLVVVSSGSESIALALLGHARALRMPGILWTTRAEHRATLRCAELLQAEGWQIRWIPLTGEGLPDLRQLESEFAEPQACPRLLSVMLVNNEIGTHNPVTEIAALAKLHGVIFHCDAIAAGLTVDLQPVMRHADLVSLAAQKCGGPAGVGLLVRQSAVPLVSIIPGGAQEFGLRAGTENVAALVGAAEAFVLREDEYADNHRHARSLQIRFEARMQREFGAEVMQITASGAARSAAISHVCFAGLEGAALTAATDLAGLALSAGSACAAGALSRSHVLEAIGLPMIWTGILRLSWGTVTSEADVDEAAERIKGIVYRMREVQASQR